MRRLHDLWRRGRTAARNATPDAELLDHFARHGDHAAFAELVDRLGPLVYGACRRLLPNPADVEDAFQATFLVLVRRADTLAGRSVGPWLHRVALWTARRFRQRNARAAAGLPGAPALPATAPGHDSIDARLDIDAAVSALPEKYRVPVILCHLQGWTRRELAAHLGCAESTASSLVGRGLAKLKKRLAGRDPAVVLAIAGAAAVPPGLSACAVRAACLYRTSSLAAAASPAVAELTEGVLRMFRVKKVAAGLAAAVAVVGLGFGLTVGVGPRADAQPPRPSQPAPPADNLKTEQERLDKEIATAKDRLKQLEAQKVQLHYLEAQRAQQELLRQYAERLARETERAKKAPVEAHILVTARPVVTTGSVFNSIDSGTRLGGVSNTAGLGMLGSTTFLGSPQGTSNLGALGGLGTLQPGMQLGASRPNLLHYGTYQPALVGGGAELTVKEFAGEGKPVIEADFHDVRSLQTYLTRAAKDPAAPKKLKLRVAKDYPWAKEKALIDACQAAGFASIELISAAAVKGDPATVAAPAPQKPAAGAPYVIEAPDVIRVEATLQRGGKAVPLPGQAVSGNFTVRGDGTVSLGRYGAVKVAELQVPAAANAIRAHIAAHELVQGKVSRPEDLSITLDVVASTSKKYYVSLQTAENEGEEVFAFAHTEGETVRDAVARVQGLSDRLAGADISVSRRTATPGERQTLPVDWKAITEGGESKSNYQLLPGDRVYVKPRK